MNKIQRIAFFDQDQTIYDGFSMHDFYLFMADNGLAGSWVYKRHKEIHSLYSKGKLGYQKSGEMTIQLTADVLANKSPNEISRIGKDFLKRKAKLFLWIKPVLEFLHFNKFKTYIISGSAYPIVKIISNHIQATDCFGSTFEVKNNKYTGKVLLFLDFKEKTKIVKKIIDKIPGKSLKIGFGDSTGDIEMLSRMDYGFIINPHQPEIYKIAKEKNWLVSREAGAIIKRLKELINRS